MFFENPCLAYKTLKPSFSVEHLVSRIYPVQNPTFIRETPYLVDGF